MQKNSKSNSSLIVTTGDVFLLGAPATGKKTRTGVLEETVGVRIFEMSHILSGSKNDLVIKAKKDGNLVDDETVLLEWEEATGLGDEIFLSNERRVHDGIPRSVGQVKGIIQTMSGNGLLPQTVFWEMQMTDKKIAGRFWQRYWENRQNGTLRDDESEDPTKAQETFKHRLSIYRSNHREIMGVIRKSGVRVFSSYLTDNAAKDSAAIAQFAGWEYMSEQAIAV